MDDDLEVILDVLLRVNPNEAAAIRQKLAQILNQINQTAAANATKAGAAYGQAFNKAVQRELTSTKKVVVEQIKAANSAARLAQSAANNAAIRASIANERQTRQAGQKSVDQARQVEHRITNEKREGIDSRLVSQKSGDAYILAQQRRANAESIAKEQQHQVRRTALFKAGLNNLTRLNQTGFSLIVNGWRAHHNRVLEEDRSANRRLEIEQESSSKRRLARLQSSLRTESTAYTAEMTKRQRAVSELSAATSTGVVGAATGRGAGGIAGGLAGGFAGFAALKAILGGGYKRLIGLENASKSLDRMGVSAKDAKSLMDKLLKTLEGTPYALDQGAAALANFVSAGIKLDKIPQILTDVADAAAFGGANLDEVATIFTKIKTKGKVSAEELNQLQERKIPATQVLAAGLGISTEDYAKRFSKPGSLLSADKFFEAWNKGAQKFGDNNIKMAGTAKKAGETTEGALANMRTAMARLGAELLKPIFGSFRSNALKVTDVINAVTKAVKGLTSGKGVLGALGIGISYLARALLSLVTAKAGIQLLGIFGKVVALAATAPFTVGILGLAAALGVLYKSSAPLQKFFKETISGFQAFTKAFMTGTRNWFEVGFLIKQPITEFSKMVLLQSSLGATFRIIRDGFRGVQGAVGNLVRTGDFSKFFSDLTITKESLSGRFAPIKDALVEGFRKPYEAALKVLQAKRTNIGTFISVALGLTGKGGIISRTIARTIGSVFATSVDQVDFTSSSAKLALKVRGMWDQAFAAARDIGTLGKEFFTALFSGAKASTPVGELASAIRDWVTGAFARVGDLSDAFVGILGNVGSAGGKFVTTKIAPFLIELPRTLGRFISRTAFSEQFIKVLGGAALGLGAIAVVVAGQFIRGFLEGIYQRRGDIGKVFSDVLSFAFKGIFQGNSLVTLGAKAALLFFAGFATLKGFAGLTGMFQKFSLGLSGDSAKARAGLRDLSREALTTDSKLANLGLRFRKIGDAAVAGTAKASTALESLSKKLLKTQGLVRGTDGKLRTDVQRSGSFLTGPLPTVVPEPTFGVTKGQRLAVDAASTLVKGGVAGMRTLGGAVDGVAGKFHNLGLKILKAEGLLAVPLGKKGTWLDPANNNRFVPDPTKGLSTVRIKMGQFVGRFSDDLKNLSGGIGKFATSVETRWKSMGTKLASTSVFRGGRVALGNFLQKSSDLVGKFSTGLSNAGKRIALEWEKIGGASGAAKASLAVAASGISGYMVGLSDDFTVAATSAIAAAASIGSAFAANPVIGALTALSFAVGVFLGQSAKHAAAAKKIRDEIAAGTKELSNSFLAVFRDEGTGPLARQTAAWKILNQQIEDQGDKLPELSKKYGISFDQIATAIAGGSDAIKELQTSAITSRVADIFAGDAAAMTANADEIKAVFDNVRKTAEFGIPAGGNYSAVVKLGDAWLAGGMSIEEYQKQLLALGVPQANVNRMAEQLQAGLTRKLSSAEYEAYFKSLSAGLDSALQRQEALARVSDTLKLKQENLLPSADRYTAAWERTKQAIDHAKDAFSAYVDKVSGNKLTQAQATQDLIAAAREGTRGKNDGEQNPEFDAAKTKARVDALQSLAAISARYAKESGGNYDVLKKKVDAYIDSLSAGLDDDKLKAYLQSLKDDPSLIGGLKLSLNSTEFTKTLEDFKGRFKDNVLSLGVNNPIQVAITKSTDFETKKNAVFAAIVDLEQSDPTVTTFIKENGGYEAVIKKILADSDLINGLNPTVKIGADLGAKIINGEISLKAAEQIKTDLAKPENQITITPVLAPDFQTSIQKELNDLVLEVKIHPSTGPATSGNRGAPGGGGGPQNLAGGGGPQNLTSGATGFGSLGIRATDFISDSRLFANSFTNAVKSGLMSLAPSAFERFGVGIAASLQYVFRTDGDVIGGIMFNLTRGFEQTSGEIGGSIGGAVDTGINKALYPRTVEVTLVPAVDQLAGVIAAFSNSARAGISGIAANYDGGYIRSPTLSTLAERGEEAVFPLTNPRRMREVLAIPPVASAFRDIGYGSEFDTPAPATTVDNSMVNTFHITETAEPRRTADEVIRLQRRSAFLGGHTLGRI